MIGLSLTLGNFPSRFLKFSFHMFIGSSWLAAVSLALEMLFLSLTSFTVCHAIRDCLSSTEFLILLIWSWIYSICSFWYVIITSFYAVLSFWVLALVGFLLLHKDAAFTFSSFFKLLMFPTELYAWLIVWLECILLLPCGHWRSPDIRY